MAAYTAERLAADLDVSRETLAKLEAYAALLVKWQQAKNLVSDTTIPDLWRRHFLDSAQLYPLIRKTLGEGDFTFLDIGSGAGFPGLVLSVMGLGHAHMVESNGKKCSFMGQVSRETSARATIHNERIEALDTFPVDFMTSRACAKVGQLLEWGRPFIGEKTEFWLLKGEGAEDELTEALKAWKMDIDRFQSLSDDKGVILRLTAIQPRP